MAELFLAKAMVGGMERFVALKQTLPELGRDPEFATMFLDEARIAVQLRHPNIAQLYDVGRTDEGVFMAMEYVHGETAEAIIRRVREVGPLPLGAALTIAAGAAAGLHHAHMRIGSDGLPLNIVHRDISPSNLMVDFEGVVKVLDFGIAKAATRVTQTASGMIKGKFGYMSPEQARGEPVDPRSDLFSLGICLYELLTLHQPFMRSTEHATLSAVVVEHVAPASRLRPDVPGPVDRLIETAMEKDASARFASAAEMLDALEAAATVAGIQLSPAGLARTMRELFGERPEPWVAQARASSPSLSATVRDERPPELVAASMAEEPPPPAPVRRRISIVHVMIAILILGIGAAIGYAVAG